MRFVVVTACLALAGDAMANGRPPQTSTITFHPTRQQEIVAGMSFGVLVTKDGGTTWRWMCEDALPYGGMYDPDYEIMSSGTLFATTFDGLKVNRDGCRFESTVLAPPDPMELKFFSAVARASDNTFYAAAADPKDGKIYKSTDEGMTFPTSSMPGQLNDWWSSLEVAASDPQRLYLSGYRFVQGPGGNTKEFLLFTSTNGGTSWTPLSVTPFATMSNSTLEIAYVSRSNPLHVFARVKLSDNAIADTIYESTNGGTSWNMILTKQGEISLLLRANGDVVAGTQTQGSFVRRSGMTAFTELTGAPHINCLVENAAGEVWACTQNYGSPAIPMDGFGIMKSTDLVTWTGTLRYQEIFEPVTCPQDTLQYMKCDKPPAQGGPAGWCGLCAQLGCDPKRECDVAPDGPSETPPPAKGGCCRVGDNSAVPGALVFTTVIGMVVLRRRRRS